MDYKIVELLSYSVGIGALICLVRFVWMNRKYVPFMLLLWAGLANEIITTIVINRGGSNAVNSNIYVLIESMLIAWIFCNWRLFKSKTAFSLIVALFLVSWVADNFFISSIYRFSSYFGIIYSCTVVFMSISLLNRLILIESNGFLRNPVFLVCVAFILFFAYKALVEIFWVYGLNASDPFRMRVYRIMTYINLAANLIYALAALWIPTRKRYIVF